MGRQTRKCPGLRLKSGVWWIDIDSKRHGRIYESTGCGEAVRELAETYYHQRITRALRDTILGVRPRRTFRDAAARHLMEVAAAGKPSAQIDTWVLETWAVPRIGDLELHQVYDGTLEGIKQDMRAKGRKSRTINMVLGHIRKVLNKAARKWRHDNGLTWLESAPLLSMLDEKDRRPSYPISWDEERRLLMPELPPHLAQMALFNLHAGPREGVICALRWAWERRIPELDTRDFKVSVFMLPEQYGKNGQPRLLVLNKVAMNIVDRCRGVHPEFVFTYQGYNRAEAGPIETMNNTAWQKARARAAAKYKEVVGREAPEGFRTLHVHDLRHTFGRRLRALGVSNETRADLLGHKNGNITTDYSAAEVGELLAAVRKLEVPTQSTPTLTVLRLQAA